MPTLPPSTQLLPQTQCTRCGYSGCRPMQMPSRAARRTSIECPPGGTGNHHRARRTHGTRAGTAQSRQRHRAAPTVAFIDEDRCYRLHQVPAALPGGRHRRAHRGDAYRVDRACTGCELCIAPCPVDCISMVPLLASPAHASLALPDTVDNRVRYEAHNARIERRAAERAAVLAAKKRAAHSSR